MHHCIYNIYIILINLGKGPMPFLHSLLATWPDSFLLIRHQPELLRHRGLPKSSPVRTVSSQGDVENTLFMTLRTFIYYSYI